MFFITRFLLTIVGAGAVIDEKLGVSPIVDLSLASGLPLDLSAQFRLELNCILNKFETDYGVVVDSQNINWYKCSDSVCSSRNVTRHKGDRVDLTITEQSKGVYQCAYKNEYGEGVGYPLDARIKSGSNGELTGQPNFASPQKNSANVGGAVKLKCLTDPGVMSQTSTSVVWEIWQKAAGSLFGSVKTTINPDPTKSVNRFLINREGALFIRDVMKSDEAQSTTSTETKSLYYQCKVTIGYAQYFALTHELAVNPLRATVSTTWMWPNKNSNDAAADQNVVAKITRGMQPVTVTLQCILSDKDASVTWQFKPKDGSKPTRMLVGSTKLRMLQNGQYLTYNDFNSDDVGTYICSSRAVSGVTESFTTSFSSIPKMEVVFARPFVPNYEGTGKITFTCQPPASETEAFKVNWFINGKPVDQSGMSVTYNSAAKTQIQIARTGPEVTGGVSCLVKNSVGVSMKSGSFITWVKTAAAFATPSESPVKLEKDKNTEIKATVTYDKRLKNPPTCAWEHVSTGENPKTTPRSAGDGIEPGVQDSTTSPVCIEKSCTLECIISIVPTTPEGVAAGKGDYKLAIMDGLEKGTIRDGQKMCIECGPVAAEVAGFPWWIPVVIAVILLILIIILICCTCIRNKGETYLVDEKERHAGHDPEKELADQVFKPYERRPDDVEGGIVNPASLDDDMKMNNSDTDSMDDYAGEIDPSKFTEDGSFINQYATNKGSPNPHHTGTDV